MEAGAPGPTKRAAQPQDRLVQDLMRVARSDEVRQVIVAPVDHDNWLVRLIRTPPNLPPEKRPKIHGP